MVPGVPAYVLRYISLVSFVLLVSACAICGNLRTIRNRRATIALHLSQGSFRRQV